MEPYAEASCVLKVNVHCQSCKMHMLEVLGSVCGKYNVDINSEEGLVRVYALVEPNLLLKALARTGYHAELKSVKLRHPDVSKNYYYNSGYDPYSHGYGYNSYGSIEDPYSYSRALPDPYSYGSYGGHHSNYYPSTRSMSPYHHGSNLYHHGSNPYYYGSAYPQARYVPSYPPKEYDPYADEPTNFCSIM
ncbi:hypothetical protein ABFS82_08G169600 [Erythranthe guttata]|uniref:uncharacterized protein LOC105961872 n=1 Tax=Erythranthe guttata TaxID=4155 RepID=UPI00064D7696|nr:PREDICTED: uncharacterized protein LOC105961872 [Erythranthe guttata]|eukprot:XP_012841590.1 PREDICTED: uncharacterized protein LOC105961872 [Erythranthe guttata]